VYGRVYLSISRQPQQVRSIQLKVVGKEDVVVHHTSTEPTESTGRSNHRHHHHHDEQRDYYEHTTQTIIEMDYPLSVVKGGTIPVGQYEYPFALQLPVDLPSSMSCRRYVLCGFPTDGFLVPAP
jgi:hypothetical protein